MILAVNQFAPLKLPRSQLEHPRGIMNKHSVLCDSATDLKSLGKQHQQKLVPKSSTSVKLRARSTSKRSPRIRASYDSAADLHGSEDRALWDSKTSKCVAMSTLPLLLLLAPQLLMNHRNLSNGNAAALAVLSWMGYLTGLGGNTLLLSYFTSKKESNAVLIQAIGIISNFAMISQIRAAGFMPRAAYVIVASIVACTATLTGLKISGRLDDTKLGQQAWAAWQTILGLVGLAVVPQVLCATLGLTSLLPSIITLSAGLLVLGLNVTGCLPAPLKDIWSKLSAWTATLLFMLQPVAQLAKNFTDPASLTGLSATSIQLAMAGNALMVPRALWTNDLIWFSGSMWGSWVTGWAQMMSLWLGRSLETGERFLPTPVAVLTTLLLAAWFMYVLVKDSSAKGYPKPWNSVTRLFTKSS